MTCIWEFPGSKWRLLFNVLARIGENWQNGGKLEQFKTRDRLISMCEVQQCSQMQPGVRVKEKRCSRCYPIFTFSYFLIIIILPTEFLCASSAWHRTPMGPSHTWGHVEVSEPLRNERRWHSNSYSIWGNAKFASSMHKHTPMPPSCYGTVYIRVSSHEASRILQNSGIFFYVIHTQYS